MVRLTLPPSMVVSPETASHTQTGRYSASTWICFKTQFRASTYLLTLSMSIAVLTPKFTTNITAYHLSTKRLMLQPLLANHGLAREIKSFLTSSTRIGTPHAFLHLYNFFLLLSILGHQLPTPNQPHHWLYFFFFQSAINLGSSNLFVQTSVATVWFSLDVSLISVSSTILFGSLKVLSYLS